MSTPLIQQQAQRALPQQQAQPSPPRSPQLQRPSPQQLQQMPSPWLQPWLSPRPAAHPPPRPPLDESGGSTRSTSPVDADRAATRRTGRLSPAQIRYSS